MSAKIAKRQLREMKESASAAVQQIEKHVNPSKGAVQQNEKDAKTIKRYKVDSNVKKLSKGTTKRRRQKAFPLTFGERPRADEKERRLRANVEKKLVGDRVLSASAMKVLMMRAGPAFKTEDVRTSGGGGASDGDSDLEDLIDDLM